jgi:hypothetical protein
VKVARKVEINRHLKRKRTMTTVMLPWVMLFQLEGAYIKSCGRPRKVAMILRWTNKDRAVGTIRIRTVSTVKIEIVNGTIIEVSK